MNVLRWTAIMALAWAAAFTAWCATGCAPLRVPERTSDEQRALEAAQAGLEAVGLGHCSRLDTVAIAYAWAPCGARNTADCVQMRGAQQTIVVREGQPLFDSQGGPIVHGAMHVCAKGDPGHRDPRVWIQSGGESSAQGRARAILAALGLIPAASAAHPVASTR